MALVVDDPNPPNADVDAEFWPKTDAVLVVFDPNKDPLTKPAVGQKETSQKQVAQSGFGEDTSVHNFKNILSTELMHSKEKNLIANLKSYRLMQLLVQLMTQ